MSPVDISAAHAAMQGGHPFLAAPDAISVDAAEVLRARVPAGQIGVFSSGSTGIPRCILRTWESWQASFAAADAMGASGGVGWLKRHHLRPLAISGVVTTSPLAVRETLAATRIPVMSRAELSDPVSVRKLVEQTRA